MNLESDLISLSATDSLFHNIGPLNFSVLCEFYSAILRAQFGLGLNTKSDFLTKKVGIKDV